MALRRLVLLLVAANVAWLAWAQHEMKVARSRSSSAKVEPASNTSWARMAGPVERACSTTMAYPPTQKNGIGE